MIKLKELEKILDCEKIHYEIGGNNVIYIKRCEVGDNFYDYNQEKTPIKYDCCSQKLASLIKDDFRVHIVYCEDCCGCAGW